MALFGGWVGFQFIGTLYMQELRGWSALEMALAFLPAGLVVAFGAPRSGDLVERFGLNRVIAAGMSSFVVSYALFLGTGADAGCPRVAELTFATPLVLPDDGEGVRLRVTLSGPDADGSRTMRIDSRPADDTTAPAADTSPAWTRHASGTLAPDTGEAAAGEADAESARVPAELLGAWPPADGKRRSRSASSSPSSAWARTRSLPRRTASARPSSSADPRRARSWRPRPVRLPAPSPPTMTAVPVGVSARRSRVSDGLPPMSRIRS